ncbi:hypothetical protein K9L16_00590 [Candidatus Pacearchaeota archaeon]|nr:hypothetical protein [Candidatus Pacearchaeota archaeon]
MKKGLLLGVFAIITVIFFLGILFALHVIETYSGASGFSFDEDVSNLYNISVENTDAGQAANITSVNITLPLGASCSFIDDSNATDAFGTFLNNSNVLSWVNSSGYLINGSETKYFWFNVTCLTPGDYNITVITTNITGNYDSNLSLEINDTTSPTVSFGTNPVDYYNGSSANITFDLKAVDYSINTCALYGNWSGSWHANQTNTSIVSDSFWNITVSNIAEGIYIWGIYCNDTYGNGNWTTSNRTITIDLTDPLASASCTPTSLNTGDSISCSCSGTDSGSGIDNSATSYSTPSTASSGTFTYSCSIADYAGNTATSLVNYNVTSQSSSGSSIQDFWNKGTFAISQNQFQQGYTRRLIVHQRVRVYVSGEEHNIGVLEVLNDKVKIEVASTPQNAILAVGDERKFEVTGDEYYDIAVTLESISDGGADITIKEISEKITEESQFEETKKETVASGEEITDSENDEDSKTSNLFLWIIVIIILIVVGVALYKKYNQ